MKSITTALHRFAAGIDRLNRAVGHGVSWLSTLLMIVVCGDVFCRYSLSRSFVAVQELEWHLFALIFLLGSAAALQNDKHVRVDVIYARLPPRAQAWINVIGTVFFLLPFAFLVVWSSHRFVANAFHIREISPDPGGLPARYLLKAMIPLAFLLILLQGLSLLIQSLRTACRPLADAPLAKDS